MVDRVLVHRMLRSRTPAIAAESALRGARASAALAGADVPLERLRAGDDGLGPVLAGALRAYAELARLRTVWHTSPRQALARLHLLAGAELVPADLLGRPGSAAGAAGLGLMTSVAVSRTTAPAIVVAARVYGDLLASSPFAGGPGLNGAVARAAFRLVLADRGLDPALLTVPEVGFLELASGEAADSYGKEGRDAAAEWVRHCAGAVLIGARESLALAEAMARG